MLDQIGDPLALKRGRLLFHEQGCVACHAPIDDSIGGKVGSGSVPLGDYSTKYTLGSLTTFLNDPVAVRPCGRMPKVVASAAEARDIPTYLLQDVVLVPGEALIRRRV